MGLSPNRTTLVATGYIRYLWALAACGATTLVVLPLLPAVDATNIAMLFLLTVVLVAARLGSGPAVLAAFASVALFDFFFVPPRFSWAVADAQYLITFAVMLVVALVIGQLAARLQERAGEASRREARTRALYEMARELSGVLVADLVKEIVRRFLAEQVGAVATLHLPPIGDDYPHAQAVYATGEAMSLAARDSGYVPALLLPLRSPVRTRGVLQIAGDHAESAIFSPEQRPLLEAVASLAAIAVERIHYSEVANEVTLRMESERLRSALLSAVSHDLRTPLTVLVGLADTLAQSGLPAAEAELATALGQQSLRLAGLVDNLLDMARLQVGGVKLRKEWQPLEEVVGSSLLAMDSLLRERSVRIDLAADLPLLEFDAVLLERVFCNLLENATKYAPLGELVIAAQRLGEQVEIAVADCGPGLPAGSEARVFNLFERGNQEGHASGVGLGLAICRAIVEAHGGHICAENRPGGGARFVFTLPVGSPPTLEDEGVD
jgi:two-component system, OmpR family, sensor histidine kinase KdpD